MIVLAGRVLAATAVAVVVAATWFMAGNFGTVTLDQALEKTVAADSLHLKIVRADVKQPQTREAWSKNAEKNLRVNYADGTYDIARQEKLWRIDEKANRAESAPSPYYFAESKSLDLLPLFDAKGDTITPKMRKNLRTTSVRPIREKIDGDEFDVYRFETIDDGKTVFVEARVNAATQLLHSLETLIDRDGRRTPLATLTVLGVNQPVDEELFVVGDTLTEDGRIGKVTDAQGIVAIKPATAERWTPICGNILLKPGDWLQTDPRGANAVSLRLAGQTQLVAGPGTLVELVAPKKIRLFSGDLKIAPEKAVSAAQGQYFPIELLGPGNEKLPLSETGVYRIEKEKLVRLEAEPKWLKGFEGSEVQESIGSLAANIDGRNVPLTVGYHKVSVEIRDQIARTTVEESFANHTDRRLEGVFYFPLPQDASISGFGMWIGNELVEADVVEKQRARDIYEQILRENRDPGLLEWSGGNLFKARVFPIEANSEKRIRIVYTQVLPRVGNSFRYSYALQSEMLKQHPLRELSIDVKLNSAVPLSNVASPTHECRIQRAENSARVEFAAKEYAPTRDFEVVAELDGKQSEVVMIPHRRGDDGYFMLMLAPPSTDTQDDRGLITAKEPLDLLLLADTSASLNAGHRARQAEFIAAVLQSLGPRDTFNLACMDVQCDWAFEKAMPGELKNIDAARQFLDRRASLGWTDLEKAFTGVFERAGKNTRVIYVGDGIPTTGNADPAAASAQLKRIYDEKCAGKNIVCHAVSVGNTFESGVLKAIAALGGGSMLQITGERGPSAVALDLLKEITRPAIGNLKVQFGSLRVARVYPEQLPNLPAGSQQILLGRYLPQGADQSGEIVVTGRQGDRDMQFKKTISLKNAEEGNSFIPRLWARMHLDRLLQQGATPAVKDEIIALSEEYHIITPYTSLLVLETDADRERFKVKRDFQMRDGEKFFAEGRDNANYELIQQQMKLAGGWRIGLRKSVLEQLSGLGREKNIFSNQRASGGHLMLDLNVPKSAPTNSRLKKLLEFRTLEERTAKGNSEELLSVESAQPAKAPATQEEFDSDIDLNNSEGAIDPFETNLSLKVEQVKELQKRIPSEINGAIAREDISLFGNISLGTSTVRSYQTLGRSYASHDWDASDFSPAPAACEPAYTICKPVWETRGTQASGNFRYSICRPVWNARSDSENMFDKLFGELTPASAVNKPAAKEPNWPEEVREISKKLSRREQMTVADGGMQLEGQTDEFNPRSGKLTTRSESMVLSNAKSWLIRDASDGGKTEIEWCDGRVRGIFNRAFQLGRLREAVKQDLETSPLEDDACMFSTLEENYAGQKVSVGHLADDQTLLVFMKSENERSEETRLLIDTKRGVVLSIEIRNEGKTTSTRQFGDFVEVAGAWWAGKAESRDEKGRITSRTINKITRLPSPPTPLPKGEGSFEQAMERELAGREKIQFLGDPGRKVIEAKKALKEGKADFDDHITLMAHFAQSEQWTRAMEHLAAAEKLAEGKPGIRWLRYALLKSSRQNEELKNLFLQEAAAIASSPITLGAGPGVRASDTDQAYLADYLFNQSDNVLETNELLTLLDALKPVSARQSEYRLAMSLWKWRRAECLSNCGRTDEALSLYRELAETYPQNFSMQIKYLASLQSRQEFEAVRKWCDRVLASDATWEPSEIEQFHRAYADSLKSQERYEELAAYWARWIGQNPETRESYLQYLEALLYTDRAGEADALVEKWFREGRRDDAAPAAAARLQAAIEWILDRNYSYNRYGDYRLEERWQKQLVETALFFARHKTHVDIAQQILNNWQFSQSDAGLELHKKLAAIFAENFDHFGLDELNRFVDWLYRDERCMTKAEWRAYARRLQERYAAESDPAAKNRLARAVLYMLGFSAEPEERLAFLRRLAIEMPESLRAQYVSELFQAILGLPWSEKIENEAFDLLEKLDEEETPERQLLERISALHRLDDRMLQARLEVKTKAIEHPEKLTRTELAAKSAENLRKTREEFADRLAREESKHSGPLAVWIAAERLFLDVQLNRNLEKSAETCWKVLDAKLPPPLDETADQAATLRANLDYALRNRYLTTMMNLAARKDAAPGSIARLLDHIDRNIAREFDEKTNNQQWKLLKFELLIALDRPKDLEMALNEFIKAGDADNRWRTALGYVQAEQGKLAEAIATFEAVAADELGPAEYRLLADWYQAAGRRADYEKAKAQAFKTMSEAGIEEWLESEIAPWLNNRGQLPSEIKPETMTAFQAILEESAEPQKYIDRHLKLLYSACRDFRLLACLADASIGQTAGRIYPFLQASRTLIDAIRDEAAIDSLYEHLGEIRKLAKTDVDRRALDLLEAMTERRAAELKNQPEPHVEKAVAALERAFKREWSPGEERLMAEFLAALGTIPQEKLAAEQLRQLQAFNDGSKPDSQDRLDMARAWAKALWNYNRRQAALDLLETEISRYVLALGDKSGEKAGIKSLCEQPIFLEYVSYLDLSCHYAEAVETLRKQLERETIERNRYELRARIHEIFVSAFRRQGQIGDLAGEKLYRALHDKILADLPSGDSGYDARLIVLLNEVYQVAPYFKIAAASSDLKQFAFAQLPPLLKRHVERYENLVNNYGELVHNLLGPAEGITFLLDRYDDRPQWLRNRQSYWDSQGSRLSAWRREVKNLAPNLSNRLLAAVLEKLREELPNRRATSLAICNKGYEADYWAEREADFLRTAEEVYARNKNSGRIVVCVAEYLFDGLHQFPRAIEILQFAETEKLLDEEGQAMLVRYLQMRDRYGESIALARSLVERKPDNLDYRAKLLCAYFHTNRKEELRDFLRQTDEYFHEKDRWGENPLAALAASCVENRLYEEAVKYYQELIPLYERTHAGRGIGDGQLSYFYANLAEAYAGLKKTPEAVEAACGAVVSWGRNIKQRAEALKALRGTLSKCENLDAYAAALDEQAAKSGLQNPLVRKALGQVYYERGQYDKALAQLRTACDLQPGDPEIHQALVACFDKQNDKQGAIKQLLASLQLSRRDLELYKELGRRLAELHEDRESERAYTSIIEALVSETESHAMLAEIRQSQNRWNEAIAEWRQVARLRALEPTGLLKLAEAQIHAKQWEQAAETVSQLRAKTWPPFFSDTEVQIQELERRIKARGE